MADVEHGSETQPFLGGDVFEAEPVVPISAKLITEFIGTFFLVLTVSLTVSQTIADPNFKDAGLAIGTILAVMIYMGGHISGAHYNPAVTIAVLGSRRGKISGQDAALYIVSQCAGAFVAALTGFYITGVAWGPAPGAKSGLWAAFACETLFTFALASVVLNVATTKANDGNHFYGYAIGMIVFVGATSVGSISGAVFNPAVGTGIILSDFAMGGNLNFLWLYWVAPCLGGSLAATVFRITSPSEYARKGL